MERSTRRVHKCFTLFTALATALFLGVQPCLSQSTTPSDSTMEAPGSSDKNRFNAPEPQESTETSTSNSWLMIGGAAALAVGAVALGSGGGGGSGGDTSSAEPQAASVATSSSSSEQTASESSTDSASSGTTTSTTTPASTTSATETVVEFTGPDVSGTGWHGTLIIENEGFEGTQPITASIVQSEQHITLRTSSSLAYAKLFHGKISNNGYITVKDAQTQKIWTSYEGFATRSYIKLYDFVNGNSAFDRLVISR